MATPAFTAPATPGQTLTPVQEQVIAFLAAGISVTTVAAEAKIHRNTIGNWRRTNPAFAQALAEAQHDRVLYWRDQAEEHTALAIQTIGEILQDRKAPASVRLRAALAVLTHATTLPPAEPAPLDPADRPVAHPPVIVQVAKPQKVHNPAQPPTPISTPAKTPRNSPCPCGSGKKAKLCCLNR